MKNKIDLFCWINGAVMIFLVILNIIQVNIEAAYAWGFALAWFLLYLWTSNGYKKLLDGAMEGWKKSNDLLKEIVDKVKEQGITPKP